MRFSKHKEPQLFIYFLKNNDEIKFQIFFFLNNKNTDTVPVGDVIGNQQVQQKP